LERILDRIQSPADLKQLAPSELEPLAREIREELVRTVCSTGGHLGAGLGAVELTIAIHTVFDAPADRIVWDVGHQCYPHKLLTGRRDRFSTLRTRGGISGFPVRSESPYDTYGTAHASTAIAAALGMALSRDLSGRTNRVVAVVGDGALTGGLAYEGLNQAGALRPDLLVILNDNEMSISPNVGALSTYLTRIASTSVYRRFETDVWELLGKMPAGGVAQTLAHRIKEGLKNLVIPNILFEELGFRYYGPIDGHDVHLLIRTLRDLADVRGPVLLHTITQKGKGVEYAEKHVERMHGIGKIDPATGAEVKSSKPSPMTFTQAFGRTAIDLAELDPRVVAITAAMPSGTGLVEYSRTFPRRFFDVGIAEQCAVELAGGLAVDGKRPIAAIYSTFLQRAIDQVIHDVALQKLPVIFAVDRGGLVGQDGPTHHGVFDIAYMRAVPNLSIMAPKCERELRRMFYTALGHEDGPVAIRYPRDSGVGIDFDAEWTPVPWGKSELVREGADIAFFALGTMVWVALEAARALERLGIQAAVVNARFVKPLDEEAVLEHAARSGHLVTIEEAQLQGGFGSAILELLSSRGVDARVRRFGVPDRFIEHATRAECLADAGLTAEVIAAEVARWMRVAKPGVGSAA
jgi:1-deoxy-D-xylulose-5-phosphate synthase